MDIFEVYIINSAEKWQAAVMNDAYDDQAETDFEIVIRIRIFFRTWPVLAVARGGGDLQTCCERAATKVAITVTNSDTSCSRDVCKLILR